MTDRNDESTITDERANELRDYSTDSVEAELEHAEGWLRSSDWPNEPHRWRVEAAAGAVGALANAWGRLTLWSRTNGTYSTVEADLARIMDQLVALRRRLVHSTPSGAESELLRRSLDELRTVFERVRSDRSADAKQ